MDIYSILIVPLYNSSLTIVCERVSPFVTSSKPLPRRVICITISGDKADDGERLLIMISFRDLNMEMLPKIIYGNNVLSTRLLFLYN